MYDKMNKFILFETITILLLSVIQINSTKIDHANQKSPASIILTNGPAPDELKAGPIKPGETTRRENVKKVLQRYIVTTGAPSTIETVYESSSITPEMNTSDAHSLDDKNYHSSYSASVVEIPKKSSIPSRSNRRHQRPKSSRVNPQFERYTNEEKSTGKIALDTTAASSEHHNVDKTFYEATSLHSDTSRPSEEIQHQSTTPNALYNDPILAPGVHSTPYSGTDSNYNGEFRINADSVDINNSQGSSNNQGSIPNENIGHYSEYKSQLEDEKSISSSTLYPENSFPSSPEFKQTHRIVEHQPVAYNPTESDPKLQRFTYGDRISTPGQFYLPQSTPTPFYDNHHHSTPVPIFHQHQHVQHIPVINEVPITELKEHRGTIQKTINVPQHGVQTKTYEIRRPAIQKQFYDIEERVIVKPAGSVVLEIDQPISKKQTGTVKTDAFDNNSHGNYFPTSLDENSNLGHSYQEQQFIPQKSNFANINNGHGYSLQSTPSSSVHFVGNPNKDHQHFSVPSYSTNINYGQPSQPHEQNLPRFIQSPIQNFGYHNGHGAFGQSLHPDPHQYISYGNVNEGHLITPGYKDGYSNVHHAPSQRIIQYGGRQVSGNTPAPVTETILNDCNEAQQGHSIHNSNNLAHYSVPIGSAVTTTQTSTNVEDDSVVVNVKHSEKYIDSLVKHTPSQNSSSPNQIETLSRFTENREHLPLAQQFSMPRMITKGESKHNRPSYFDIKSNEEPQTQQRAVPQNFGANTLYTMQSVVNNNLFNPKNKQYNNDYIQNSQISTPNHPETNNKQQYPFENPVHSAYIQQVNQSDFNRIQQVPKSVTSEPFIVYAVTQDSHDKQNDFRTPSTTVQSSSRPMYQSSQNYPHFESTSQHAHHIESDTTEAPQGQSQIVLSTNPHSASYNQVNSLGVHIPDIQNFQNQAYRNKNHGPVSHNISPVPYQPQNYQPNSQYSPLSGSQNENKLKPVSAPKYYNNERLAPYQNLQNKEESALPCNHKNPLLITSPQQFTETYSIPEKQTITPPVLNGYNSADYSFQNFQNKDHKQNTQFNSENNFNQPQHLPSSNENDGPFSQSKMIPQHIPQFSNFNNQPNEDKSKIQIYQTNYDPHKSIPQFPINVPQEMNQPSESQFLSPQQFNQQTNLNPENFPPSNYHNSVKSNPDENPELYATTENSQPLISSENQFNSQLYPQDSTSNNSPNTQHFSINNKLRTDAEVGSEPTNKMLSESDNDEGKKQNNFDDKLPSDVGLYHDNYNSANINEYSAPKESEETHDSNAPAFQIVAGSGENNHKDLPTLKAEETHLSEENKNVGDHDSEPSPTNSYYQLAHNVHPADSSISFHPLPIQSQNHILQYLLSNKGQSAHPVLQTHHRQNDNHQYGYEPFKTRVVSATPASKFAKPAGEKVNTRRIVINQPIETVQVIEEREPFTTYKQITVEQPTIYKTETQTGVKQIESSVPVLVPQPQSFYHENNNYHGQHYDSPVYIGNSQHFAGPAHEAYRAAPSQRDLHNQNNHNIVKQENRQSQMVSSTYKEKIPFSRGEHQQM